MGNEVDVYGDLIRLPDGSALTILYTEYGDVVDITSFSPEWLDRAEHEADA